jgi:predicted nucleic acid-binding protein
VAGRSRRGPRRRLRRETTGIVIIDSGAVSRVAGGAGTALVILRALVERGWRLVVPAVVLVECLTGDSRRDADVNRFLHAVGDVSPTSESHARAASALRYRSGNTSVIDGLVAEAAKRAPGFAIVMTTDPDDIERLVGKDEHVRIVAC